jgi:hypothetical protein
VDEAEAIVEWLAGRPVPTVGEVAQLFPPERRSTIARGLLWIARYGIIVLRPPADRP